jgi:tetratricopeptide (TPR) repeat protein
VNLSTECYCNEPYLDIVQNLSGLNICEENLDQYSWQSLFQKGKFYRSIALLNAKVQEDYLQTVLKIVRKDRLQENKKAVFEKKILYYLGIALYAQKNWNAAYSCFQNSENNLFAKSMKAACLKQRKDETEYKEIFADLPEFEKQLCHLRVNFEHPLKTRITISATHQLGHIETLLWRACQEKHLNFMTENTTLKEQGVVEKIDNSYRVSVFNPLNFYYLSVLLLQKAKQLMNTEVLLAKKNQITKKTLSTSKQIMRYYQKYYCLSEALIFFQDYENALSLIKTLKKQMNNNPIIQGYLSLLNARCLWEMGHKKQASAILSQLKTINNNTLLIQKSMLEMKLFPDKSKHILNIIKDNYRPKHCDIPHSQHWVAFSRESCIPWYHAVGQGYIHLKDYQAAMLYYMESFNIAETKNQLSCYNMDYLINLLKVTIERKKIGDVLQFILNDSAIVHLFPEIQQLRIALGKIQQYKQP